MPSTPEQTSRKRKGKSRDDTSEGTTITALAALATGSPKKDAGTPSNQQAIRHIKGKFRRGTVLNENFWDNQALLAGEKRQELLEGGIRNSLNIKKMTGSLTSLSGAFWEQSSKAQSKRLKASLEEKPAQVSFFELFSESKIGFDSKHKADEKRAKRQKRFRKALLDKYNAQGEDMGQIWEPVLGEYIDHNMIRAAHLYPWSSHRHMRTIFGSDQELFEARNGLLIHHAIERALDLGFITIVPHIPIFNQGIGTHPILNNAVLRQWESTEQKDYMVWVLKDCDTTRHLSFSWRTTGPRTINDLHARPFQWKSEFRPAARFIWWAHLNSVMRCSLWQGSVELWKDDINTNGKLSWAKEVNNATRYWGTKGHYIKKNALKTFIDHLGSALDDDVVETMKDKAVESEEPDCYDMSAWAAAHKRAIDGLSCDEDSEDEGM